MCGIGFIADLHGRKNHQNLQLALSALKNLQHRGGINADGLTSDGVGVLTQIPRELLCAELEQMGLRLERPEDLAVGMLFLPPGESEALLRAIVERAIAVEDLRLLGWRRVPIRPEFLGAEAATALPRIVQVLVCRPPDLDDASYERHLYLARRRIDRDLRAQEICDAHVVSFSHQTIVYKGLCPASRLGDFYLDLADPRFKTAIALFHQRYSTNTRPAWSLAQPFRMLAHNGEINTIAGNINGVRARERCLTHEIWEGRDRELRGTLPPDASDSAMLDAMIELLVHSGRDPLHASLMLVPEALDAGADPDTKAFHDYHAGLMEPWDGPAALVFTDGSIAAAALDRNGLRPMRYQVTTDGLVVVGSETGIVKLDPNKIVHRGRLGPGQRLAVDTDRGELLYDAQIRQRLQQRRPYRAWVKNQRVRPPVVIDPWSCYVPERNCEALTRTQILFRYGREELERIFVPMMRGQEPMGSMGDDTPLAMLSCKPQRLSRYFKQRFAQVTNPPIDPLRERLVMSLETLIGPRGSILAETEAAARLIHFSSPIILQGDLDWLAGRSPPFPVSVLGTFFEVNGGAQGLQGAIQALCAQAMEEVSDGAEIIVLSDRGATDTLVPIPMLLAMGAVHQSLMEAGLRAEVSIVCDTGDARQDHDLACLIGCGADLVHPYVAFESVASLAPEQGLAVEDACLAFVQSAERGLRKIMSKLGICEIASYRGAQAFEIIGLAQDVVARCFAGVSSRVGGMDFAALGADALAFHSEAGDAVVEMRDHGDLQFRRAGEHHAFQPKTFKALHTAVRNDDAAAFESYTALLDGGPACTLRDLLDLVPVEESIPLSEVEPVGAIARRFRSAAMSYGALSREAHELLALAMNEFGGQSNSGEGGEDPDRYGTVANSAIKQIATGRFGVTPAYLGSAKELEIKISQGSKPGEGGQIPGHKVTEEIAKLRFSVPGVTLISPPPHHDIYSIEDLAQLIHDLRRSNPSARIAVKLVAIRGVGVVATGVAKANADTIHISGHDGGTGASPLSAIKNAGVPWELGLSEAHRALIRSGLRDRVRLRVDGGLRTARDLIIATLLGADEFSFGTTPLLAAGCVMARQCHANTCPVGIATQDKVLRARFRGEPEHVIAFMAFVANDLRKLLAELGLRSLSEAVGRTDLLQSKTGLNLPRGARFDSRELLAKPPIPPPWSLHPPDGEAEQKEILDDLVWRECRTAAARHWRVVREYKITNRDRSVGTRLAGEIARATDGEGLGPGTIELQFTGVAGQSFGAFIERGMRLDLCGDAQDYVGKGMHGGEIALRLPAGKLDDPMAVIAGNTLLYGATGGQFFAAGRVGERFAVRNSGALAVVEGCGDHGCEYMTGGIAVVLGPTGRNFGAGMSGGIAYVLDEEGIFPQRCNPAMLSIDRPTERLDMAVLRRLVERHVELTQSRHARRILACWKQMPNRFWKVTPTPDAVEATARAQCLEGLRHRALSRLG